MNGFRKMVVGALGVACLFAGGSVAGAAGIAGLAERPSVSGTGIIPVQGDGRWGRRSDSGGANCTSDYPCWLQERDNRESYDNYYSRRRDFRRHNGRWERENSGYYREYRKGDRRKVRRLKRFFNNEVFR